MKDYGTDWQQAELELKAAKSRFNWDRQRQRLGRPIHQAVYILDESGSGRDGAAGTACLYFGAHGPYVKRS
ncbi:MAG: hypothetical protein ACLR0U_32280 [Enterocloster clostridioformis]